MPRSSISGSWSRGQRPIMTLTSTGNERHSEQKWSSRRRKPACNGDLTTVSYWWPTGHWCSSIIRVDWGRMNSVRACSGQTTRRCYLYDLYTVPTVGSMCPYRPALSLYLTNSRSSINASSRIAFDYLSDLMKIYTTLRSFSLVLGSFCRSAMKTSICAAMSVGTI